MSAEITQVAQTTGENVRIGKTAYLSNPAGTVALYLYAISGKIGVLMSFTGNPSEELVRNMGGHIAFARPMGLTREEVPAETIAKEREFAVEQAKATGKPSEELVKQIGGHIAFARPVGMTRDEVPADLVAKEKEFAVEQAKATGKPQNIAEKIAEGKLNAFYKERALVDQDFFNSQKFKGSISDMLKSHKVTLEKYVRIEVGQS